jgi:hypothetical protein
MQHRNDRHRYSCTKHNRWMNVLVMFISIFVDSLQTYQTMLFDQKANLDTGGAPLSLPTTNESKVTAPRNPTLNRGPKVEQKVC